MAAVGALLREWRQRRRLSQLELASEAEVSTRHLSFVETGRALPSREMLLHLSEQLAIPLRERNRLLEAAGYAAVYPERALSAPPMELAKQAVDLVLRGHEPYPALAIDRHWNLVASNKPAHALNAGADRSLLQPPVNVLRLTLHPLGLAPHIANLAEWRAGLLARLHHEIDLTGDPVLVELMDELRTYPAPPPALARDFGGVVVPLELVTDDGTLTFFSTTTVFGTPVDITLSELAIEAFFPADAATAELLRRRFT